MEIGMELMRQNYELSSHLRMEKDLNKSLRDKFERLQEEKERLRKELARIRGECPEVPSGYGNNDEFTTPE
jgi:hypothetical protein